MTPQNTWNWLQLEDYGNLSLGICRNLTSNEKINPPVLKLLHYSLFLLH